VIAVKIVPAIKSVVIAANVKIVPAIKSVVIAANIKIVKKKHH